MVSSHNHLQAKLEELKRKIDENARKAGITGESEAASERALKVSMLSYAYFF